MENERKSPYTNKEVRERLESELARNNVDFSNKAALAKKLGCSPTTIFRWMSGSLPKDPALMYEFAKMFNIDIVYWISGDRGQAVPESILDEDILRESLQTVEAFQATTGEVLTDAQKAKLVNMTYSDEVAGNVLRKTLDVISK